MCGKEGGGRGEEQGSVLEGVEGDHLSTGERKGMCIFDLLTQRVLVTEKPDFQLKDFHRVKV